MSVLVCVPTVRDIHASTVEAAFGMCANHPGGASFRAVQAQPVDRCRTLCVQGFLDSPHDHLMFLDSDVVPPAGALSRLLEVGAPIACGVYPLQLEGEICASVARKVGPDEYGFLRDLPSQPFEADAAGLGCCLIAREVFECVVSPWFRFVSRSDGHQTGEDIWFFERCVEAGIRPVVVPGVLCGHHRTMELGLVWREIRSVRSGSLRAAA